MQGSFMKRTHSRRFCFRRPFSTTIDKLPCGPSIRQRQGSNFFFFSFFLRFESRSVLASTGTYLGIVTIAVPCVSANRWRVCRVWRFAEPPGRNTRVSFHNSFFGVGRLGVSPSWPSSRSVGVIDIELYFWGYIRFMQPLWDLTCLVRSFSRPSLFEGPASHWDPWTRRREDVKTLTTICRNRWAAGGG